MKILHLTLKKKWFDMIIRGDKKEEYREIKPYWDKRLNGKSYEIVRFRNGYAKDAPTMDVEIKGIRKDVCVPEWSDGATGLHYVIELNNILEVKNVNENSTL